jgi:hypothetical protein
MNLAVKLYGSNPKGVPSEYPELVVELGQNTTLPDSSYVLMTLADYYDYLAIHRPAYDAWYTSYMASLPVNAPQVQTLAISSQPDPAPFAQPTFRTKRSAVDAPVSISSGGNGDITYKLLVERYATGGSLIVENAEFGDYFTAEVEDLDGVIPYAYRPALCENWPIVSSYVEKEFVEVDTPGSIQAGAITVHRISTMPLNAKITAGLYLCMHYYCSSKGLTRQLAVNYHFTKKL